MLVPALISSSHRNGVQRQSPPRRDRNLTVPRRRGRVMPVALSLLLLCCVVLPVPAEQQDAPPAAPPLAPALRVPAPTPGPVSERARTTPSPTVPRPAGEASWPATPGGAPPPQTTNAAAAQTQLARAGNLPFQIIIGERAPVDSIVTLATGAVTAILTPEVASDLHSRSRQQLELSLSDARSKQAAIFLRPVTSFPLTHTIIEMPSGTVSFFMQAIDVPELKNGQFNGEVLLKPAFYTSELQQAQARTSALAAKLVALEEKVKAAEESVALARRAAESSWDQGVHAGRYEALAMIETVAAARTGQRLKLPAVEREQVRITQSSPAVAGTIGYWVICEVENRSKQPQTIRSVTGAGGGSVLTARRGPQMLRPGEHLKLALYLEESRRPPAVTAGAPELRFALDGVMISLPVYVDQASVSAMNQLINDGRLERRVDDATGTSVPR